MTGVLAAVCAVALLPGAAAGAAAGDVRDVEWRDSRYAVPPVGGCPAQEVPFADGAAVVGDSVYRFTPRERVRYADVTGEGVEDALLFLDCGPRNSEYSTALVGMTTAPDGSPTPLGTVVNPEVWTTVPTGVVVRDGLISVGLESWDTGRTWTEHYRWAASAAAFVRVG
ncbi:hypothetical protein [Saccharopolyspora sp. CA-218241]|uniref:hypothetical protein n=1 Tax=Saccharopolyspora sp. CA-218241 TaxID=3240027 RepID=UPI003D956B0E